MKKENEIRLKNTDNYRKIGLIIVGISIIVGVAVGLEYNPIWGISIVSTGIGINLIFQIAHSICYRLDLIIDKK